MSGRKVLAVDDSRLMHKMYGVILREYDVVSASNGLAAIECLRQHTDIRIILLDIQMPRMGGLEFLSSSRAEFQERNVPVVIIAAAGREEDTQLALEAGASAYINKPFGGEELLSLLERLILR